MTLLGIPPHPRIGFTDGYDWKSTRYLTAPLCYCIFRKIWQASRLLWQRKTASWQGQGAPVCGTRMAQMKRDERNHTHPCRHQHTNTHILHSYQYMWQDTRATIDGLCHCHNLQHMDVVWLDLNDGTTFLRPDWCTEMWDITFSKLDKISQRSKS